MKARIRRFFERARHTYAQAARVQALAAARCAAAVPPGPFPRVLEIGAGAGLLAGLLARRITWDLYVALDLTPGMLAFPWGGPGPLARVLADGERPPFAPGSFDLVVSSSTLQWFEEPEASIPVLLDLLRPGGRFAFSLFTLGTLDELAQVSRLTGFGSVHPLRPAAFYTGLLGSLPGLDLSCRELAWTEHHASVPEFLHTLRRTGTQHSGSARPFSRSAYGRFLRTYQDLFADQEHGGRVPATYRAVLAWGRKGEGDREAPSGGPHLFC